MSSPFTADLRKKCTGTHCEWRDRCKHHGLPTTAPRSLILPIHTGEACDWFSPKGSAWGDGADGDAND